MNTPVEVGMFKVRIQQEPHPYPRTAGELCWRAYDAEDGRKLGYYPGGDRDQVVLQLHRYGYEVVEYTDTVLKRLGNTP